MLNRRILRVKAFQTLYAYEQCKGSNLNLAKDYIREEFQPDLNSMEIQDKAVLEAQGNAAIKLLDECIAGNKKNIPQGEDERVTTVTKTALEKYLKSNKLDRDFLINNMVNSAERIPQLYLTPILLLIAFSDHVGTESERKRKLENPKGFLVVPQQSLFIAHTAF